MDAPEFAEALRRELPDLASAGALALAAFWTYVYVLGRRAVGAGATGDLAEHEAGATVVTAG